ncbi:MAG TPA: glycosyltransferase family 4 protein [Pseudonocardiaceae bacterium]|jgi:rhamnosyl/mannosyltransferase|nr:glycosyltransferase family 4 protein [Pseudonocardiaceae bacterium]
MSVSPVIQITPYYPPHLGGMEKVVRELALRQRAVRPVTVLTTAVGGQAGRTVEDGVVVSRRRAVEVAHTAVAPGILTALLRTPRDASWHLHAAHAVLPEQVALAARIRRQRFVVHFHLDVDPSGRLGWLLPRYKRLVFGAVLRAAAGVIVLTTAQARFVESTYRVPAARTFVVPNGVADEYFLPVRPRSVGPLRLLFVGRLSPQKNVARLLHALAKARLPIVLDVVGDGELRSELGDLARRLGLTGVTFHGRCDGAELVARYRAADAFVLPSNKEGMPLAALEAMAAGLPVIATRVPGNEELLAGVGLLVEPEPSALADALDLVAGDEDLRGRLAAGSAEAARRYTWAVVAEQVAKVYREVLS